MADKEAVVYIVDLGSSMGDCAGGRVISNLDFGMQYVWDKIMTTTAASRKTWQVGVLGLSTDDSNNELIEEDNDGYDHISVLQDIGPMSMEALRSLQAKIKPSENMGGDALSAIIVAVDMISKAAPQRLKYKRKIIMITDGQGGIDASDIDAVAEQINDLNIELIIIGIDFDDAEYGFKEEDKPSNKAENEKLFHKLVSKCGDDAVIGTMAQAVEELEIPRLKSVRPFKSYDGPLTLGNPNKYDENSVLSINVERYFATKLARPVPASRVVLNDAPTGATQSTHTLDAMDVDTAGGGGGDLAAVKMERNYSVKDPTAKSGSKIVSFDELEKGYAYGRTAVYLSESDRDITTLETVKGFSIVGFVPNDKYEPMLNMAECCVIVSRKHSEKDELSLSALIHTLYETESCAVARLVTKDWKEPLLLLLMPSIEPDFECLYDVPLPFAEDVRHYQFPPLDKVITINGNTLTKHRTLPNEDLKQAMSDYVDAMDISEYGKDDEGNAAEYAPMDESFSPMIHRVNQAIRFRALHADKDYEPSPEKEAVLKRFDHPPEALVEKKKPQIEALIKAADIKKVPPKSKSKFGRSKEAKPVSGNDIGAVLRKQRPVVDITVENAVPAFKDALRRTEDDDEIAKRVKEMGETARELIKTSAGSLKYNQALENIRTIRDAMLEVELPALYNAFLRQLRTDLAAGKLGGPRQEVWYRLYNMGLGLITTSQSGASDVSDEAAHQFLMDSSNSKMKWA